MIITLLPMLNSRHDPNNNADREAPIPILVTEML
jgi:hypothetical protein